MSIKMAEIHPNSETETKERDNIDIQSQGNMEKIRESDEPDTYEVAGGKYSLHGVVYQRKLLMFFAIRSINKHKNFKLATEMKMADKIDDAILIYPKLDGTGNLYRFLQAKHRSGEVNNMRKISAFDLLKETDGDFSIPTYFRSYLKIIENSEFLTEGDEIFDLIICSNAGLWLGNSFGDFILTEDIFEVMEEEDFIFGKTLRKLKQEFPSRKMIVSLLMNCFSKFPENFAKSVSFGRTYDHSHLGNAKQKELEIERLYEIVFLEEVVNLKSKRFREGFVAGVNLTGISKHFRSSLLLEWERLDDEGCFENWLRTKVVDVNGISEDHGLKVKQVAKKLSETVRKNLRKNVIEINDKKSLLYMNMETLKLMDVLEMAEGGLRFSKSFLNSDGLCETAENLRKEFSNNLSYFKIDLNSLGGMKFELRETLIESKKITIRAFNPEKYVIHFLSILVFALDQPNEKELGIMIKDELKNVLIGSTVDTAYSKLYTWIDEWLSSPKGKFLTEDDFKKFFDDLKEEVIFDLRDPVSNFTGRLKELNKLYENLFETESKTAVISQTASISGFGGIGKSELARMFAKMHRNKFNNILWIDCEDIATCFRRLAFDRLNVVRKNTNGEEKSIDSIVEEVHQRLRDKKTLFVFDNAEQLRSVEGSKGIQKYMAPSSECKGNYYLITSRNQKWGNINVLSLEKFTDEEAIAFFNVSLGESDDSSKDYKNLADALGNFPLAMQHAAAYIKETSELLKVFHKDFTVSDYLEKFREKSKELLEHEFSDDCEDQYTRTTYTTMILALESISSKDYGSISIEVMNVISYLCPDRIQPYILSVMFEKEDEITISKALLLLQKYSLISLEDNVISVHRLLQLVIRITLKDRCLEEDILKSILRSHTCLDLKNKMSLWDYIAPYSNLIKKFSHSPSSIVYELVNRNEMESAVAFSDKIEMLFRNCLGYYDAKTIQMRVLTASYKLNIENLDSARERFRQLQQDGTGGLDVPVDIESKMFGNSMITLFLLVTTYEEVREFYGESHPTALYLENLFAPTEGETTDLKKNLFEKLASGTGMGKVINEITAAVALLKLREYREALEIFQKVKKEKDSQNLFSVIEQADLMIPVIKIILNENYRTYYEVFERKFDEILTKTDRDALFYVLFVLRELDWALFAEIIIKTFRKHYENFRRRYGDEELRLAEWRAIYGKALSSSGFLEEGLKELLEAHVIQKKLLDEKNPSNVFTRSWIASTYCDKGDHREALRLHKENLAINGSFNDLSVLKDRDSQTGIAIEHSHLGEYEVVQEIITEVSRQNLTLEFRDNERSLAYLEMIPKVGISKIPVSDLSQLYEQLIEWFGENSFPSLEVGLKYSLALYDSGNTKKSRELLERIRSQLDELGIRGEFVPEVTLIELLSTVLNRFKMIEVEKCYLLNILKTLENFLGKNKPRTLLVMCKLALVEFDLGNIQNSRDLVRDIEKYLLPVNNGESSYARVKMYLAQINAKLKEFVKSLEIMQQVQLLQDGTNNLIQEEITDILFTVAFDMCEKEDSLKILKEVTSNPNSSVGFNLRSLMEKKRLKIKLLLRFERYKEARKLCRKILLVENKMFGKEDVDTVKTKVLLAASVGFMENYTEALKFLTIYRNLMCEKLGENDAETLKVGYYIGRFLCSSGRLIEGTKYLMEVFDKQHTLFGDNNEDTVATKCFLDKF